MRQPTTLCTRLFKVLRGLRVQQVRTEADLYTVLSVALHEAGFIYAREVSLWTPSPSVFSRESECVGRIDYLVSRYSLDLVTANPVGIEVKAGPLNHPGVLEQLTRYSHALIELVLVTEQGCRDLTGEIGGMAVYQVVLSHAWGLAV